ncbi:MAG: hypothetical protein AAF368_13970, partial [Planctomycetota bacterium]
GGARLDASCRRPTMTPTPPALTATRRLVLPTASGELVLEVPRHFEEPTLLKEIAGQDVLGRRLLEIIRGLEHLTGTNRELLLCSQDKLQSSAAGFLSVCGDLRRLLSDLASYQSAIPQLHEARENVRTFFTGRIGEEIERFDGLMHQMFPPEEKRQRFRRQELGGFRKRLAKSTGMVHTELQKIFDHLCAKDPRNLYRLEGPRSEQDILVRQFRREVEVTEHLYHAVRRLDTYMRGAIVPSDLLQMIASRIDREGSIQSLFDADYALFLTALVEEVLEILLPEMAEVLHLDGIWYDDFENVERKSQSLFKLCTAFRAFYQDRYGLRLEVESRLATAHRPAAELATIRQVFDTFRYQDVSTSIRELDQVLVDLEGALLQWEKGVARRAFARREWQLAEPFQRKGRR